MWQKQFTCWTNGLENAAEFIIHHQIYAPKWGIK
jgi:hypothetical protein